MQTLESSQNIRHSVYVKSVSIKHFAHELDLQKQEKYLQIKIGFPELCIFRKISNAIFFKMHIENALMEHGYTQPVTRIL